MANHLPPTVEEDQKDAQAQDAYDDMSATQAQSSDPPEDLLRNAPTFPLEEEDSPEEGETEKGASSSAASKPGFLQKIMLKLGLNPIILMSMFKSVYPHLCTSWRSVVEHTEADPGYTSLEPPLHQPSP